MQKEAAGQLAFTTCAGDAWVWVPKANAASSRLLASSKRCPSQPRSYAQASYRIRNCLRDRSNLMKQDG